MLLFVEFVSFRDSRGRINFERGLSSFGEGKAKIKIFSSFLSTNLQIILDTSNGRQFDDYDAGTLEAVI